MPDALELPGMRRAVVPLVRSRYPVVLELVADRLPGFAAVARALHLLPEPAGGLRRVQSIRVGWRSFEVVHLPPAEVRAVDVPFRAFAVRRQHKRAFFRPDQYAYAAHRSLHVSLWSLVFSL